MIIIKLPLLTRSKKNSQQILINSKTHRPFISQSKLYKEFEQNCGYFLNKYKTNINYPVNIKCHFYMKTRKKVDIVNLLECIDDCFVRYGTVKDDNYRIIAGHDGTRVFVDPEKPRTEIWIEPLESED